MLPSPAAARILSRVRLPLISAPMFIVSNPKLVVAQCKAGVVGSFPALNARPQPALDDWLYEIKESLAAHDAANPTAPSAPFAVNQIVHKTNARLMDDMETIVKHKVPIVITSLGARKEVNDAVHSYGGIVLHDVINDFFARKAIEKGADGLVAVAAGAGGHAGMLSPFALVQEIREWFDGPVALSGAISSGRSVLAAQAMGADFAYAGSAFIATHEANAADAYKEMIVECDASEIVYTNLFTGVHGNYLRPSISNAGLDPDNLPESDASAMGFGGGEIAKPKGATKAWRDVWGCGQGIGAVKAVQSTEELVERVAKEYEAARMGLDLLPGVRSVRGEEQGGGGAEASAASASADASSSSAASSASASASSSSSSSDDGFVASAPKPLGAYAHSRRVGDLVFLAGLGPRDAATNTVPGGEIENADGTRNEHYDAAVQTRACIDNCRTVLAANGLTLADVVDVQCFLVDMKRDFAAFNAEYASAFGSLPAPPTRTTMEIAELPPGGRIAVELKIVAKAA